MALLLHLVVTFGFFVTVSECVCHLNKNVLPKGVKRQPGCWMDGEFHPWDSEWISPVSCEECHCYRNGIQCCSSDIKSKINPKICMVIVVNCTYKAVRTRNPNLPCPFGLMEKDSDSTDSSDSTESEHRSKSKELSLKRVKNILQYLHLKKILKGHSKSNSKEKPIQKQYAKSSSQERHIQEQNAKNNAQEKHVQEQKARSNSQEKHVQEQNVKSNSQEKHVQQQNIKSNSQERNVQDQNAKNNSQEKHVQEQKAKSNPQEKHVQEQNVQSNSQKKYVQEQNLKSNYQKKYVQELKKRLTKSVYNERVKDSTQMEEGKKTKSE